MKALLPILILLLLACQPDSRRYAPAPAASLPMPDAVVELPSKAGYESEPPCPPPPKAGPHPYDMCLVRDCQTHGCQFGWAAPEVSYRCGLGWCINDGHVHATCPEVVGVQTELKICGGDEPPQDACFRFGSPLIDESSNAYCCTADAAPLPAADCAADSDCNDLINYCQFAQCWLGRCHVQFKPDGTPCTANGNTCYDGECEPAPPIAE